MKLSTVNWRTRLATRLRRNTLFTAAYILVRDTVFRLRNFGRTSYSQHGEDQLLLDHVADPDKGFFIDIGASHPFRLSNTYAFYRRGWRGVSVDPIPHFRWLHNLWRPKDTFVNAGVGSATGRLTYYEMLPSVLSSFDQDYVEQLIRDERAVILKTYDVEVIDVNTLFANHAPEAGVDLLSLDVEGLDYEIISALDFDRFAPRVVCVEVNDDAERIRLEALLSEKGYRRFQTTDCNLIASDRQG